jgi:single-strand DNA-binding protein
MAALNKVMLIGNLGRDPEVRMAGESKVANFSIAVTEKFKGREGTQQEKTEWVNIVFWGRQAEICEQYLRKGSAVYIEGKLETRSWDDKATGEKKYRTEVRGILMQMLGGKGDSSANTQFEQDPGSSFSSSGYSSSGFSAPPAPEDDLPF